MRNGNMRCITSQPSTRFRGNPLPVVQFRAAFVGLIGQNVRIYVNHDLIGLPSLHFAQPLAQCRLGYLETIQLEHALSRVSVEEAPGFSRARLAIVASSTVDHLVPAMDELRTACDAVERSADAVLWPFPTYHQMLFQ